MPKIRMDSPRVKSRKHPDQKFLPLIVSRLLDRVADLEEAVSDLHAEVDGLKRRPSIHITSKN